MFGKRRLFPPVEAADEDGLLRVGGQLSPSWLLEAYRQAIFPWPVVDQGWEILAWFSPDPRAVIELDGLHVSRRLARRLRQGEFRVTCNRDFAGVVAACAAPRLGDSGTWITPSIQTAYRQLHRLGHAHSLEVWYADELVGGIYGVALGGLFAGESMFSLRRDASKYGLACLVSHLAARGFTLFDIQQITPHTRRMGAIEISRALYCQRLDEALSLPVTFGNELELGAGPGPLSHLGASRSTNRSANPNANDTIGRSVPESFL